MVAIAIAVILLHATPTTVVLEDEPFVLEPLAFARLPVGAIQPAGWLRDQLEIAADGYTGHLCDWYGLCVNSTWLGGDPEFAQVSEGPNPEVLPYWLNGAAPLAFLVDNLHLSSVVGSVVDYILEHPQPDGILGGPLREQPTCTVDNGHKKCDAPRFANGTLYWSKAMMVLTLQAYAEGNASDTRTIPALEKFMGGSVTLMVAGYTPTLEEPANEQPPRSKKTNRQPQHKSPLRSSHRT